MAEWLRKGIRHTLENPSGMAECSWCFWQVRYWRIILCGLAVHRAVLGVSFVLFVVFADLLYADMTKEKGMLKK